MGQIVGDGSGFLIAWSSFLRGEETRNGKQFVQKGGNPVSPWPAHELMVARLNPTGGLPAGTKAKQLSNDGTDKGDVSVVWWGDGYLIGYTEGLPFRGSCYDFKVPESKLVKLDAQANVVGGPEAIPSANLPQHGGGLTLRARGEVVWITGITPQSFRLARLAGPPLRSM
jgi:hypothetical protein